MATPPAENGESTVIRTPDQRLRVFISSTLRELADERAAVREAVTSLHLAPILFELGARPHPPQDLYRAYLAQSHIFIGIYWQNYGWVAPDMDISGLEDEYRLAGDMPKLIYIKAPAPDRQPGLDELLKTIKGDANVSYKYFSTPEELKEVVANDLALLLTERFEQAGLPLQTTASTAEEPTDRQPPLPIPPTTIIGRETEVADLLALLPKPGARLVTLTGPGGVGKTRLSIEIASQLADEFPHGVHWVPLAALRSPDLVVSAIAQVLDVRERAGYTLLESLKDYLRDRCTLLLLDNFEQVLPAGPLLSDLLSAAPDLKILITSRAPLQLRGEQEYPVPPLQLPETLPKVSLDLLKDNPAVRLFVERAQAVNPDFMLTPASAQTLVEIVHRLDGLPLAIELAAAHIRLLTPNAILSRLESRLKLLTGGAQDLPHRQQTIRSTIEWSYSLLDPEAQTLFTRLGVFVGGFTFQSAEAICNPEGDLDVFKAVVTLSNNNLVHREAELADQQWFSMLETIHEYALERLLEIDEATTLRRRHAFFFSELAAEGGSYLYSGEGETWLNRLEEDYNNFRAALAWFQAEPQHHEVGWKMLVDLIWLWYRRGYLNEARQWYAEALQRSAPRGDDPLRANILVHAGAIAMWQSDLTAGTRLIDEGLEILRASGEPLELATALFTRGVLAVNQGDSQTASALLDEALPIFEQIDHKWFQAMILLHLGNVALHQDNPSLARDRMSDALVLGRRVGDGWIVASALNNFGEIARYQGDIAEAEGYYLQSRQIFQSVGSTPDVARENHSLGYVALSRGDHTDAHDLFKQSLDLHQRIGMKRGVVECLAGLAGVMLQFGEAEVAVRLFTVVRIQFEALGMRMWPADKADFERNLNHARDLLDSERFAAAEAQGRELGLEAAITTAKGSSYLHEE